MKNLQALFLFIFTFPILQAQIVAGDVAVVGMNMGVSTTSGHTDGIAIMVLADLPGNTDLYITDNPTNNGTSINSLEGPGPGLGQEGTITWTTPAGGVTAGSVVTFSIPSASNGVTIDPSTGFGSVSVSGWNFSPASSILYPFNANAGDNILIYTGSVATPTWIYGFISSPVPGEDADGATEGWHNSGTGVNKSVLPSGLVNSNGSNVATAHAMNSSLKKRNLVYSGPQSGTKDYLLTEIGKNSNWTTNDVSPLDLNIGGFYFPGTNPIFSVTTPCSMTASITSQSNVSCNGSNDGSLTVTASSGTANYDYTWSNSASTNGSSSSSNTITGLAASTYTVTVTDNNGCTAATNASITEPAVLVGGSISF